MSDLYNLLAALVKRFGGQEVEINDHSQFHALALQQIFSQPCSPPLKIKHGKVSVSYGSALTFFVTISSCFVDKTNYYEKAQIFCFSNSVT